MCAHELGRGLSALFGDDPAAMDITSSGASLKISDIEPNPNQPRRNFDRESLESLARSIRENGVLQPVIVRRTKDGAYRLIAGERRWRAARIAGLSEIPVQILEADDLAAAQISLIENLQREDLDPIEEAAGYQELIRTFGLTQEDAASRVGRSRPAVANSLRLLSLSERLRAMVSSGTLSPGHARALLAVADEKTRERAADEAVAREMSVRELERYVKTLFKEPAVKSAAKGVDYAGEVSRRLTQSLGRRVTLRPGSKKGKIEIEYYGNDDLDTLIASLEAAAYKQ